MKRSELPEKLFNKINVVKPYPSKVKPIMKMLDITAFFPGGRGLWLEEGSDEFPSILVLGQDFSNVKTYNQMLEGTKNDLQSLTWRNLIKLFNEAEIDLKNCFFSNVYMGLRDTAKTTGKFPGSSDKNFVNRNLEFLSFQIEIIKPKLIITLGRPSSEMLSKLSKSNLDCWKDGKALSEPNNGYKSNIYFNDHICCCVALEHTSMRNSNVKRREYGEYKGHQAEVEMLKQALKRVGI